MTAPQRKKKKATPKERFKQHLSKLVRECYLGSEIIGVDPDLHSTSVARLSSEGQLMKVMCSRVPKTIKGQNCAFPTYRQVREMVGGDSRAHDSRVCFVAVEGQRVRRAAGAETKNPQSLVELAVCGGMAGGAILSAVSSDSKLVVVEPVFWKGSVPKQISHARILKRLGWDYEKVGSRETGYCRPINKDQYRHAGVPVSITDWKHMLDAIGIAHWLYDLIQAESRRRGREE